jgi:rod shape-determining protein MreD
VTAHLKLLGLGVLLLLLHALGTSILPALARPDFVLIFVLTLGLRIGGGTGALALAFLMGFCVDVLSGSPLGLYALLRGTACVVTRLVDRALYLRASLPWAIYVMAYAFVDAVLMSLTLRLLVPEGVIPWGTVLLHVPLAGFITAILAVPLLSATQRLEAEVQGEGAWTSLSTRARV